MKCECLDTDTDNFLLLGKTRRRKRWSKSQKRKQEKTRRGKNIFLKIIKSSYVQKKNDELLERFPI